MYTGIWLKVADGKSTAFTMCTTELQTLLSAPPVITVALFAAPIKVTVVWSKFQITLSDHTASKKALYNQNHL